MYCSKHKIKRKIARLTARIHDLLYCCDWSSLDGRELEKHVAEIIVLQDHREDLVNKLVAEIERDIERKKEKMLAKKRPVKAFYRVWGEEANLKKTA
ncbi:MAG TPA: hypothetical protein VEI57_16240 [Nitrospirota bacterium]|nr:hypothetical protein [Nitrospirota bacterium]